MGIRILAGGRKIDVPNVLVHVQALDAPFPQVVEGRSEGADDSEFRFRIVGFIDNANRLAWL
jgi:hypothetical protein